MVLGLRTKSKKSILIEVDFTIHIHEIKPWPPSQSLKSVRSVVLQWENGYGGSGSTKPVAPSPVDGKIVFNASFKLETALLKEPSSKRHAFQKNVLDLNLYEPRSKSSKGQLLGNIAVDLAEYGMIKEAVAVRLPVNSKRSFKNTTQPVLYMKIQPLEMDIDGDCTSSRESMSKEGSLDKESKESVSALMSEEYAEEAEFASFTDDDVSSHSSLAISSSTLDNVDGDAVGQRSTGEDTYNKDIEDAVKQDREAILCGRAASDRPDSNLLPPSSKVLTSGSEILSHGVLFSKTQQCGSKVTSEKSDMISARRDEKNLIAKPSKEENNLDEFISEAGSCHSRFRRDNLDAAEPSGSEQSSDEGRKTKEVGSRHNRNYSPYSLSEEKLIERQTRECPEVQVAGFRHASSFQQQNYHQSGHNASSASYRATSGQKFNAESGIRAIANDRSKNLTFSVRSSSDSVGKFASLGEDQLVEDVKEIDSRFSKYGRINGNETANPNTERSNVTSRHRISGVSDIKLKELELKMEKLKSELREAATMEIGLYSIVAEHGSSKQKVHTPARRLSRLYLHAYRNWTKNRRASAAKSAAAGLITAAKACGNDVSRLTFWLSNAAVLRSIISQTVEQHNTTTNGNKMVRSPLKSESSTKTREGLSFTEELDWENPYTLFTSLEKIEAWIFSRVVESVWWQILTPYMQSANEHSGGKKGTRGKTLYGRASKLGNHQQVNLSIEIWKNAFQDASERLCPVRAGGHECGCLPMLAKLVMEQCVARLDVAMFNAIFRESDDEMPTDPLSDPISDSRVVPVPSGKSSFGAGAQLKNAIGTWSRWLADLFGMDTNDDLHDEKDQEDDRVDVADTLKPFRLLNAFSDLLMLPKDMLLSSSIRKEVCPTFSASMIKQTLERFQPDEFCPDPIPDALFEALESEDSMEGTEAEIKNLPCSAFPIVYIPPTVAAVQKIVGDVRPGCSLTRSKSSVIRKCQTSDDELDELDSPLTLIVVEKSSHETKRSTNSSTARYQLLGEVWRSDD